VAERGPEVAPGGSCANVITTAALLGARTTFCGQVGDDRFGHEYAERMGRLCGGHHLHVQPGAPTGKCLSLVSRDGERTMATTLGCAIELEPRYLFRDALESSRWFHLTGYLFTGGRMGDTAQAALEHGRRHGVKISLDVADAWVVNTLHDRIWSMIEEFADVVFTNEEESRALCGGTPEDAVSRLAECCEVAVVKLGARGSLIRTDGETVHVPAHPVARVVDTTGAGDAFAGGFLFGLSRGLSASRSGLLAARVASEVVGQTGAVVTTPGRLREIAREVMD